jgi:hypothetical protein
MRWPTLLKRPSFLIFRWMTSPWFLVLGPWMRLLQLDAREPAEAAAFENARDAGFGDANLGCDVLLGWALTAQLSTASAVASGIWLGNERGLENRSRKPSTASA